MADQSDTTIPNISEQTKSLIQDIDDPVGRAYHAFVALDQIVIYATVVE